MLLNGDALSMVNDSIAHKNLCKSILVRSLGVYSD